ncbi:uncharacterized protein LOC128861956 [Anastrepha ludens]|uniref:uncharacterized protein LOC128861956 n=1 Tax=Anastrepha ludens TaxID=28586 RepID=UPI0023B1F795|nr:uncharacterized protein LOC128861956 [Anastrepha ludens]
MRHHVDGLAHQGAAHALCATSEDGYALPCINSGSMASTWVGGLPRASGNHGRSQSNLTSVYGMEAPSRNRSSITTWTGHPINTHCTAAKTAVPFYPPAPFTCNRHFTPGLNNLPSTVLGRLEAEQSPRAQLHSTSWHALPSYVNMHTVYGDAAPGVGSIPPVNSVLTSAQEAPARVPNSYDAHRQWPQISIGYTPTAPAAISEMGLSSTQIASRQVINKDLPTFSGKPEEWPLFITSFEQSTEQCGFTDSENLIRLQRCLKGVALEAVRGKLMAPATVWQAIETLRMLYGRPDVICHSLQRKLRQEPLVRYDKLETLIQFALAVQNYCCTLKAIGLSSYLNDPMLLSELLCKLPSDLKLEWGRYRVSLLHADISEFDYWLFKLATCASQVVSVNSSGDDVKVNNNPFKKRLLVHDVVHTNSATSSQPYCLQCSGDHRLEKCKQFCDLSTNDRWCFVRDNKLCIRCFRKHFLKNCPLHSRCGIDDCTKPHHVLLHSNHSVNPNHKAAVMLHKEELATKTLLRYVPVVLYGKSKCIKTYALIDEGSTCTILEKHIAEELGLDGPSDELCLRWTGDITQVEPKSKCVTIGLSSTHETSPRFNLRNIRTVANLDLPKQSLLQEVLSSHSHLHNLPIEPYAGVRATLLLGVDNAKLGVPLKVKEIEGDQLIATKCRLGWSVYGRGEEANALSNRVMHICSCVSTERMDEMLKANYALEAVGISMKDEPLKSKADERDLAIMKSTTKYLENEKRWETGLLWKFDKIDLPNSYSMALQRLSCLEKRMTRDPLLRNFLNKQIREYEDKGYIRKLTKDEISHGKRSWFIPIFTVTNKNKNKTRLVWDAAATVDGIALNTYLMKGPDLLASLVGILIRFRERAFVITGDIREMFHQIRVRSKDQTAQQFLWRHGNSSRDPDTYVMTVMTFGAACSPSLANFIKNKNASRFINENASAVGAIHRNMYVDDWLQSVDTEKELIDLALQVKHIHGEGGFEMRNWLSNSTNALHAISRTAKQSGKLLQDPSMTYEKVLGIWWLPWSDELTFFAKFDAFVCGNNSSVTKGSVLRVIMSVYDPLGLIGFFMIQAKIIMQNIWRSGVTWDAPVQKDEHEAWQSWVRLLPRIHDVRIPRCYPLASFTHDVQLHIFCDASSVAYAAAAYLRATVSGKVKCCLVASKSRVAPLKPVSIPRLELMGAILGLRLAKFIRNELTLPISEEVYWTDSKNVLHWIRSDSRKFSQFVGVRIGEILESSSINNWRWVPSADNVADDATKLKQWSKLDGELRWFQGPQFLTLSSWEWPETILVNSAEHELVHHIELNTTLSFTSFTEVVPHVSRFSKWEKLRGATRYALRFLRLVSRRPAKSEFVQMMLQDTTVNSAEILIVLMCQSETNCVVNNKVGNGFADYDDCGGGSVDVERDVGIKIATGNFDACKKS